MRKMERCYRYWLVDVVGFRLGTVRGEIVGDFGYNENHFRNGKN